MSFLCTKVVTRKPSKDPKRKNARQEEKKYYYVYEAETRRDKRNQKVKHKILGRVGPLVKLKKTGLTEFSIFDVLQLDKDAILKYVLERNLTGYGFEKVRDNLFINGDIEVDLNKLHVVHKDSKKGVVLNIHDGYLCNKTLKNLFEFDLRTESDLSGLAVAVRNIGLLQLSITEEEKGTPNQVDQLIHAMSRVIEKEDYEPDEMKAKLQLLIEQYKQFMAILVRKYPNFKMPKVRVENKPVETASMDEFRKQHGW